MLLTKAAVSKLPKNSLYLIHFKLKYILTPQSEPAKCTALYSLGVAVCISRRGEESHQESPIISGWHLQGTQFSDDDLPGDDGDDDVHNDAAAAADGK